MSCIATLKEKGLKLTPQRLLIVDVIHDARGHLTAIKIIEHVQAKMPGVNKSTIYRTLDILEQAGCVYKSELDNEFIYHHDDRGHHHHLKCTQCGKVVDCDEEVLAPLENSLEKKYKFRVDFKHLVIDGICHECLNKNKQT
jgi:Fur family transcriptional regulator, ferric uptake regulator